MKILIFDTETTGLPMKNKDLSHQPHIVQLSLHLCNEEGLELSSLNLLIDGDFEVPEITTKLTGITKEMTNSYGVKISDAINIFNSLTEKSDITVAHNLWFDKSLIGYERKRLGLDHLDFNNEICTMQHMTNVIKMNKTEKQIKSGVPGKYKQPKLVECIEFIYPKSEYNYHNAKDDVLACKEVFFYLLDNGVMNL